MKCENGDRSSGRTDDSADIGEHELGECPTICDACYDHLDAQGMLNVWEDGRSFNVTKIAALVRDQGEECFVDHRGGNIFTLCAGPVVAHDLDTRDPRFVVVGCGGAGDRDLVAAGSEDVIAAYFEIIPDYSVDEQHVVFGNGPDFEWSSTNLDTEETIAAVIVKKIRERTSK